MKAAQEEKRLAEEAAAALKEKKVEGNVLLLVRHRYVQRGSGGD